MKYLLLLFICFSCNDVKKENDSKVEVQEIVEQEQISLEERISKLREYYPKAKSGDERSEKLFFKYFPDDFLQLNQLYGFDREKGAMPLYDEGVDHIAKLLFNLKSIDKQTFLSKAISIAQEGVWDADAISYFQEGLQEKVGENLSLAIEILKSYAENDIRNFWKFYFDGPHPKSYEEQYVKLKGRIEKIDSSMASIVEESYQTLLEQSDH